MNAERIAEIERITTNTLRGGADAHGPLARSVAIALREYAALLRAAEGPELEFSRMMFHGHEYVPTYTYEWQRAGRLLALAENERLKAQLAHVIGVLRRDGYWAALMTDAEVIEQIDAARAKV